MTLKKIPLICLAMTALLGAVSVHGDDISDVGAAFLNRHCVDCHGKDTSEAGLTLHDLSTDFSKRDASALSIATWKLVIEKVAFNQMPPEDEPQPDAQEKRALVSTVEEALAAAGYRSNLKEKLRAPEYGNYVDHDQLFDRSVTDVAYSPARLWKKSPFIFDVSKYKVFGSAKNLNGQIDRFVKQPFAMEDKQGFRDFAELLYADSATLETLLRNAAFVVDKQLEGSVNELDVRINGPPNPNDFPKDKNGKSKPPRYHKTIAEFREIVLRDGPPTVAMMSAAIGKEFERLLERAASEDELAKYISLMRQCIIDGGNTDGLRTSLMAIAVSPEAVYRMELGKGHADEHGRHMLSPPELAFAIAYALTDTKPDETLLAAARSGKLQSREDVLREVARIWHEDEIEKPRVLRFFQEFFGYHRATSVFKDDKRFGAEYTRGKFAELLVQDADTLVLHIVKEDRDVLEQLLTTDRYFVAHSGDNDAEAERAKDLQAFYHYFKDKDYKKFAYQLDPDFKTYVRSLDRRFTHSNGNTVRNWMKYLTKSAGQQRTPMTIERHREYLLAYDIDPNTWDFPTQQPFVLDKDHRIGLLMHPSWLIAHSLNLDNDPVRRGKWIRERLLAGTVPELPITVDARIPEDPHSTLRERFSVIEHPECWKCHVKMNPLGMPLEAFDDFGRYRIEEKLHAPGESKPVNSTGRIDGSFDDDADGDVADPIQLVRRLAKTKRVRQSFVRHSFRYWMGRNEMRSDASTLVAADDAYVENGGSFRELVFSLLTSDSFLYRR